MKAAGTHGSDHHGLEDTQWNCRKGEYNELATLLHSAQEGVHLVLAPALTLAIISPPTFTLALAFTLTRAGGRDQTPTRAQ